MKKLSGSLVRRMFLDYFKSKQHSIHPSQSLIPVDDPTLLWINSGVATLKKYFDGRLIPETVELRIPKKQFVQMILKMSEKQPDIILFLKC